MKRCRSKNVGQLLLRVSWRGGYVAEIMPNLKIIVAVCDDWGIGLAGDMVVANRADMKHFVRCTKGLTVIMGRKTLLSFPGGRPLKDRRNIVLSRDLAFAPEGVEIARSVGEALALLAPDEVAWVVGGGAVYREFLPWCSEAVVTKNHCARPSDTFFPNLDADPAWEVVQTDGPHVVAPGEGDEGLRFDFVTYRHVPRPGTA